MVGLERVHWPLIAGFSIHTTQQIHFILTRLLGVNQVGTISYGS